MKAKSIITIVLLLFVALSVVYLIMQNVNKVPVATDDLQQKSVNDLSVPEHRMVAYYFHGNARCATCMKLESYAEEAITTAFQKELENGTLEWQVVNTDELENEHFIEEYNLSHQMVVLVEYNNGKQIQWKSLEKIWDLVGDKPEYVEYVQSETRKYLDNI